jgi:hypothetical protein
MPKAILQEAVDAERAANRDDHSNWVYFEENRKAKEQLLQWVVATQAGSIERVITRNGSRVPEAEQRSMIQTFLHNAKAQQKQMTESKHDNEQIDVFLKLLPNAFIWTEIGSTAADTSLHYEPDPSFHPPTREARVFSAMAGDLVVSNQQHRIRAMSGHLMHDVTFGGGLLGRLKEGSSFSLEQAQVGEGLWQLSTIHVHLQGNALLFKSLSLEEDDERSHFKAEPALLTLDHAATIALSQADDAAPK